jgi:hypothetical protein
MVCPSTETDHSYHSSSEDDLGRLVRWGVGDSISGAEPPADTWPRILKRVRNKPAPTRGEPSVKGSAFPAAPFVQAVVVSALLLAFALGVEGNVVMPREHRTAATPTATHRARGSSEEFPEDMLRGYLLAQMEQGLPRRMGGAIREAA